ncbi:MAG: sel1 repeat family protein [Gammaproteobacteria bacterium]|nr:sel1 repeat family protein [Gammaproteobacteria bacterium]
MIRSLLALSLTAWAAFAAAESIDDLRARAEQGSSYAQVLMGVKYHKGDGVPQDMAEAARWSRMAAEQGDSRGQYNLGAMYDSGDGVSQDFAEAAAWYRKAAEQGDSRGQYSLGDMYQLGQGVDQSDVEAYRWFSLAAVSGNDDAIPAMQRLAPQMTAEEIAEAERLAQAWQPLRRDQKNR